MSYEAVLGPQGWIVSPIVNPESGTASPGLQKSLGGGGWTVTPLVSPCSGLPSAGYNKTLGAGGWTVDPIPDPCNDLASQVAALFAAGGFKGTMVGRDMPTLDQDNLGASPVTALNQTVGRRKDQSGLANHFVQATSTARPLYSARKNLLTNSAWAGGGSAPTGWSKQFATGTNTLGAVVDGNQIYRFTATGTERPHYFFNSIPVPLGDTSFTLQAGDIYSGSVRLNNFLGVVSGTAVGTVAYYVDGVLTAAPQNVDVLPNTRVTAVYSCTTAGTVSPRFGPGAVAGATVDMDASRPMQSQGGISMAGGYQRTGLAGAYDDVGFPRLILFDLVDDALVCTFGAALGTNCTVMRSVPGLGATLLTGQNIGTTITDTQSNHALVALDGPLTPEQTALVLAYGNQQAQP